MNLVENRARIRNAIIIGLVISAVAGIIMGVAWPGAEIQECYLPPCDNEVEETGSMGWVLVGATLAWVGSCFTAVGLLALAVRYGMEAAEVRR